MVDNKTNDLFMYMTYNDTVTKKIRELNGESSLQVSPNDDFMKEFNSSTYTVYSNFFDVTQFDFNLELSEADSNESSADGGMEFSDWYQQEDPVKKFASQSSPIKYDIKKISGSISKVVDSASPLFFQNCCLKQPFKQAILVKRAFVGGTMGGRGFGFSASIGVGGASLSIGGGSSSGDSKAMAYLRIEMKEVLITQVGWDDGDVVSEKLSFSCKAMVINYKRQKDNGTLLPGTELFKWPWPRDVGRS
jgi:type VI protein secretion system component Hcp